MPTNQPKAAIEEVEDPLIRAYVNAWERMQLEQQAIAADPTKVRRKSRLTEMQQRVSGILDEVDDVTRAWIQSAFPEIYAMGASAGAAEMGIGEMVWTQVHQQAVQSLAQDLFNDLLKSTKFMRKQTKDLVRDIAKDEALQKAIEGKSAREAARLMEKRLVESGLKGIRYKDGSHHGLGEYSQMAIRTKTATAYNTGTLNEQEAHGVKFWECFDGPSCGWSEHNDTQQALGRIVTRDEALGHPISHPNCRRAFGARPDITSKVQAKKDPGSVTKDQIEAQKLQDAERLAAQQRRAASRARQKANAQPKPQMPSPKPQSASAARREALLEQRNADLGNVDLQHPAPATDDMILKSFLDDPYKDVPTVEQLMQDGWSNADAIKEHKRLKANAASKASKMKAKLKAAGQELKTADVKKVEAGALDSADPLVKAGKADKTQASIIHSDSSYAGGKGYVGDWTKIHETLVDTPNYVPVQDLHYQGATIKNGIATKRYGIFYMMETPAGEVVSQAMKDEFEAFIKESQVALLDLPPHLRGLQKSVAFLRQNNPVDDHWAKVYNKPDFKSAATGGKGHTAFWNTKPWGGTMRHEFGHTLDDFASQTNQGSRQVKWGQAQTWDHSHSATHHMKAQEVYTGHHPLAPGTKGVTDYGACSPEEDFAESVRLYMKDQHDGVLAYSHPEGIELRFRDIYPGRARELDKLWGVDSQKLPPTKWDVHASVKAQNDFSKDLDSWVNDLNEVAMDMGGNTYTDAADFLANGADDFLELAEVASGQLAEKFGVGNEDWLAKRLHAQLIQDASEAKKTAAKSIPKWNKTPDPVAPVVTGSPTPSVAEMKKALPANVKASIASKKSNTKKLWLNSGYDEAAATAKAAEVEAAEVEKRWRSLTGGTASKVATKAADRTGVAADHISPDFRENERSAAKAHLSRRGGNASSYKNAIATNIAERLDNPEDWEIFRQFYEDVHASGSKPINAAGSYAHLPNAAKAKVFFNKMAGKGIDKWTAADVDEFIALDLKGHPAWDVAKAHYDTAFKKYGPGGTHAGGEVKTLKVGTKETAGAGKSIVDQNGKVIGWAKWKPGGGKYGADVWQVKIGEGATAAQLVGNTSTIEDAIKMLSNKAGTNTGGAWDPAKFVTGFNNPLKMQAVNLTTMSSVDDVFGAVKAATPGVKKLTLPEYNALSSAKRREYLYNEVNARVSQWASNSGDSERHSVWMQMAAKDEFGTTGDPFAGWNPSRAYGSSKADVISQYPKYEPMYRTIARRMYEQTQDELAKDGIEYVSVYRGMSFGNPPPTWAQYGLQRAELQPINSFSVDKGTAKRFANGLAGNGGGSHKILVKARVPRSRIIGSARSGFGCLSEGEFVIMDSDGLAEIVWD